ncbi:MAG TPA: hypothetical protein VGJ40_03610 [Gaiellaceae bacterium]|jgi:hypothetical protein
MRGSAFIAACIAALAVVVPATAATPHVAPSDRQAINQTLDVFVNHAVKRHNPGAAYDVLTPTMKGGMSRAQWQRGSIPVYPYPAAGRHFHEWTVQYRTPEEIALELILSPTARNQGKLGQILFHVYLHPSHGRWLVDSFMPGATFAPIGKPGVVQAARDFQANPSAQTYNRANKVAAIRPTHVSSAFAVVPFALVGLVLAGLAAWGLIGWVRNRRVVAAYNRDTSS